MQAGLVFIRMVEAMWEGDGPACKRSRLLVPCCDSPPRTPEKVRSLSPSAARLCFSSKVLRRCEEALSRCSIPISYALLPGDKGEDDLVIESWGEETILAVFDGHRSREVVSHAAVSIVDFVRARVGVSTSWGEALKAALCDCNESARVEGLRGGSTVVIVAVLGNVLWCCNAGDSRAVAGLRGGGVKRLSVDHRGDTHSEVLRIKEAGGSVWGGRLGGMLQVTRGLGDFDREADGFSCAADVAWVMSEDVEFVILASDGLWDVLEDAACCGLVREWGAEEDAAGRLGVHARSLGSIDDISVIVARFAVAEKRA